MNAAKRYKDIDFPFICPVTKREFKSGRGLAIYISKTLKEDHSKYYDRYINHRDNSCFFCGGKGKFISVSKGYRNLCTKKECVKKSFNSHSVEGMMYRKGVSKEEAKVLYEKENKRQLKERLKTHNKLRKKDPLWDKRRSRNCKEFWIEKGYTKKEALIEVKKVMDEIHKKTFKKFKENKEHYAYKYTTRIEYYLNKGYTKKEAKNKLSNRQKTFSKKICIDKYGEKEGKKIWKKRQKKWQKSLIDNGNLKGGYSKISQTLFYEILNYYKISDLKNIFFWTKNREYYIKSNNKIYLYDFVDIKNNKVIEYNGDQYHANPKIYEGDSYPHPFHKTNKYKAEEIWKKDKHKIEVAERKGFEVFVVWDSEYKKNPKETLEKCLDFLNN